MAAGADEQRDLWLESLPGDQLRVPDLGHVRESTAFFGSWFWGGASIGDATGPAIGYLTGSTPGLVRFDAAAGSALGDATTTLFLGRSGRGKTTAAMLGGLDSAFAGAWVPLLDLKGDAAGVSAVAAEYGVPTALIEITAQFSGAADLLRVLPVDDALLQAPSQLMLLLPPHLRGAAEAPVMAATRAEIQSPDPSSWGVIQRLCAADSETTRTVGFALRDLVETGLGSVVAGPPSGLSSLTTNPGLWVVQMPGLTLPSPESAPESWSPIERVGMACLRGCLAWMVRTTGRREFRGRSKVVIVPEVHLLTKTPDGASFLDYIARVGRALGASLVLDTQDPASILKLPGLVEQITTLFAFSLRSREQVDSLLELLGRPQTAPYQTLVRGINTAANGKSIRHGHCIMRDRWDEVATVQIDIPSQHVAALLRTTPESEHANQPTQPIAAPQDPVDPFADDLDETLAPAATAQANAHTQAPEPPADAPATPPTTPAPATQHPRTTRRPKHPHPKPGPTLRPPRPHPPAAATPPTPPPANAPLPANPPMAPAEPHPASAEPAAATPVAQQNGHPATANGHDHPATSNGHEHHQPRAHGHHRRRHSERPHTTATPTATTTSAPTPPATNPPSAPTRSTTKKPTRPPTTRRCTRPTTTTPPQPTKPAQAPETRSTSHEMAAPHENGADRPRNLPHRHQPGSPGRRPQPGPTNPTGFADLLPTPDLTHGDTRTLFEQYSPMVYGLDFETEHLATRST